MRAATICILGAATGLASGQVIFAGGAGGAIPDNGGPGDPLSSTIPVTSSFEIADLSLNLSDLNHTFVGDLIITLEHGGTSVVLVDQPGVPDFSGFGWAYNLGGDYTFDDDAIVTWDDVNGGVQDTDFDILSGSYLGENPLAAFNGMDVFGDWTLTISDNAGADVGSLGGWSILVIQVPTPAVVTLLGIAGLFAARRRR